MPELDFDLDAHRYTLDGAQIPACTAILTAMGASPGFNFLSPSDLEFYRSRGHAVHSAVEYSVKGTLDHRTVVEEVKPYLEGWNRAVEDYKIEVLDLDGEPFVEKPLCHPLFRYGVKPDVVARIGKESGTIEIKATSAHAPATGLQLAAQLLAVKRVMPKIGDMRIGLRLLPKAPYYDLRYYVDKSDEATWISFVNTYHWLTRHKLLKDRP